MTMEQILTPIKDKMKKFELLIDDFLMKVEHEDVRRNFQQFFKVRGKFLRPMLLMLSAGATSEDDSCFDASLLRLALIIELLHSASLIHDDIVDNDSVRRGEKTVNQVFGNKIAVLAGDTLFSYAFKEATKYYEKDYSLPITHLAFNMCMSELVQANGITSKDVYLNVIHGKTAEFMAITCELGAKYGGGNANEIERFYQIGLNIGMLYQMIDDVIDKDSIALSYISQDDIEQRYSLAKQLLEVLRPSEYKESLTMLLEYVMEMKDNEEV